MSKEVKEIVRVGFAKHIALLGYTKSENIMFPSSAQMQIYDTEDEPFEDCTEAYVDFFTEEQVDNLIEALKRVKESFKSEKIMNKEQLKRGNELQQHIEDIETKIEASKAGLDYPEHVSIKICFNGYNPYELDTIMKKETIQAFKDHYEKL